jgi:hypothetical protein
MKVYRDGVKRVLVSLLGCSYGVLLGNEIPIFRSFRTVYGDDYAKLFSFSTILKDVKALK